MSHNSLLGKPDHSLLRRQAFTIHLYKKEERITPETEVGNKGVCR